MCIRERSESARGNRSRDHPASLSSLQLFCGGMADARQEDESNNFEVELRSTRRGPEKDDPPATFDRVRVSRVGSAAYRLGIKS